MYDNLEKYTGNVFVVSRLGQLRNVQNFIKQFNAKKNILIVQFSVIDGAILKNICELCDRSLYAEIIYVKLPQRPLRVTKKKNIQMYNKIKDTILYINENYEFNNLFLCNADKWYSYYEKIKIEENLNYTFNLLEEGLTTYIVSADPEYQEDPIIPINGKDLKKACKNIKKSIKKIIKELRVFIVKIISLLLSVISIIFRTNLITIIKKFVLDKTLEEKYKFSYIKHFDNAFVCFPEKLEQNNFSIDNVQKLEFNFNKVPSENFDEVHNDYVLFINQKYINYKQHFELIFKIFTEMGYKNIYIKLHPKEDKIKIMNQINECLENYPDLNVKVLNNFDSIPIEDVIYSFKFKKVVGLISSSLIYCEELIQDIEVISIAERYRQLCYEKENAVNPRELKLFEKEYKTFRKLSSVKQYKNKLDEKGE